MITRRHFLKGVAVGTAAMAVSRSLSAQPADRPPNIIFILADDIGYGDLGCYGANKVKTPNLDRIAREGVRFTDAHSTAAVCTPTRYSFLTGQYAWRNPDGDHILSGVAPLSVPLGTATVASQLKQAGYATGQVGKWHLGLGAKEKPVDYNNDVTPGPLEVGFDYAFFFPATGDRVPCVFVENHRVVGLDPTDPIQVSYDHKVGDDPTGEEHPELLKIKADKSHSKTIVNGVSRIGYMSGGNSARWVDEDIADTFTRKAVGFIEQHKDHPFFLYFAPHDIHEPMVPNPRFRGTSECGWRGDAIHQLDWSVGEVLGALDRLNLSGNTLIIFTSDNGGAIKNTYDDGTNALHALQPPNGPLRGEKGTLFEGGHREPFLARWPGKIQPGTTSDELIALIDMLATFTAISGGSLATDAGPDSFNVLPALLGETGAAPVRDHLVLQINGPKPLAVRQGPWKLITQRRVKDQAGTELNNAALYNLSEDLAEENNVAKKYPEKVKELSALLERVCSTPRSRP